MNRAGALLLLAASVYLATAASKTVSGTQIRKEEIISALSNRNSENEERHQEQLGPEQLIIVARKSVELQKEYHVSVSLLNCKVEVIVTLRLVGRSGLNRWQFRGEEVKYLCDATEMVKFKIGDWPDNNFVLTVKATAHDGSWNFTGGVELPAEAKAASCFIQTDRAIYKPGQQARLRALLLTPALIPEPISEISTALLDPQQNIIKRWQHLHSDGGLLPLDMQFTEDSMLGNYLIRVESRGREFTKQITVSDDVLPTFGVTIDLPSYATYKKQIIVIAVKAQYTYGKPVRGLATLKAYRRGFTGHHTAQLEINGFAEFELYLKEDLKLDKEFVKRDVEFFVSVEEELTGRKSNQTKSLTFYPTNFKIELVDKRQRFKPGMSNLMRYKVVYQDDTPVEDDVAKVELRYGAYGRSGLTDFKYSDMGAVSLRPVSGYIDHELEVPASFNGILIYISANYKGEAYTLEIYPYKSLSRQYIQIRLPQWQKLSSTRGGRLRRAEGRKPSWGSIGGEDVLRIDVHSTEPMRWITCQILSRSDVVWVESKRVSDEKKTDFLLKLFDSIKYRKYIAPEIRIFCFRVRDEDKELIADTLDMPVSGLFNNTVALSPSLREAKPGQEIEVSVSTQPRSLVGILGIDQSALLPGSGNDFDQKGIMDIIRPYGPIEESREYWYNKDTSTKSLFEESGIIVLSNTVIAHGWYTKPNTLDGHSLRLLEDELQPEGDNSVAQQSKQQLVQRKTFPKSPFSDTLWQVVSADSNGQVKFSGTLPNTTTSWQLSAFTLHDLHGFNQTSVSTSIRVFKPFFIKLNLPHSTIRGETIVIRAVVFNYSKKPIVAEVTLENHRGELEFVGEANASKDEKKPGWLVQVTVPAEDGASALFSVRPTKLGRVDVRISAQAGTLSDGSVGELLVKPAGREHHLNKEVLIRLSESQSTYIHNVSIEVPKSAVEGSQRLFVSVIGDILGAGLKNLDKLLKKTCTSCFPFAEMNIMALSQNIMVHNYLQTTRRLREGLRYRATDYIEIGYRQLLVDRRPEGTFSGQGIWDEVGSVWLTAYVLRSLQHAKSIIRVDKSVLEEAAEFLAVYMRKSDGIIEEPGILHTEGLAPYHFKHNTNGQPVYLTAYSVIALQQHTLADTQSTSETSFNQYLGTVIKKGLEYLELQLSKDVSLSSSALTTYDVAVIAYALILADGKHRVSADHAYELLWARANKFMDQIWWSSDNYELDDSDVQISAWVLLTTTKRGEIERGLPIAKWLVSQQQQTGDFATHQGTVLALEALEAFAKASAASQSPQSIDVEFSRPLMQQDSGKDGHLPLVRSKLNDMPITSDNAMVLQQARLPDGITWFRIQATGSGVALVQVSSRYNLLLPVEKPAFELKSEVKQTRYRDHLNLTVCTFYKGQGAGEASNVTVAEVELPSGYVADVEALPSLKRHTQIRRINIENGGLRVVVYIEKVTQVELCFMVPARKSGEITTEPVPVTIYDYYDREKAARVFYKVKPVRKCNLLCDPESDN